MPRGRKVMRVHRAGFALLLALAPLALTLLLTPLDAAGQGASAPRPAVPPRPAHEGGARHDPENITGLSLSMEACGKGNERYVAKDFPGAIALYKKALQLDPRNPLGHYLLGEGQLAMNDLPEAEAAFLSAAELEVPKATPVLRSHVLFAVADVYDRQKKWESARAAWQTYTAHAARLGAEAGGHPQSGVARLEAIDAWLKLDAQYEAVRQRIAAERAEAGAAAGDSATKR